MNLIDIGDIPIIFTLPQEEKNKYEIDSSFILKFRKDKSFVHPRHYPFYQIIVRKSNDDLKDKLLVYYTSNIDLIPKELIIQFIQLMLKFCTQIEKEKLSSRLFYFLDQKLKTLISESKFDIIEFIRSLSDNISFENFLEELNKNLTCV